MTVIEEADYLEGNEVANIEETDEGEMVFIDTRRPYDRDVAFKHSPQNEYQNYYYEGSCERCNEFYRGWGDIECPRCEHEPAELEELKKRRKKLQKELIEDE